MRESTTTEGAMLSIGALSRATAIPAETLRTWERRYGFPVPVRRSSGHRRYPMDAVGHLRLIKQALDRGNRPSTVVGASEASLRELIGIDAANRDAPGASPSPARRDETLQRWLDAALALDGTLLDTELRREWSALGARPFVLDRVLPFLREVGERWSDGTFGIIHEHFASIRVRDFLASQWRPLNITQNASPVVCAALSEEYHDISLHIAALVLTLQGLNVVFLGADTPPGEIAQGANQSRALAIVIASSPAAPPERLREQLQALRRDVPRGVPIILGGAPIDSADGVVVMDSFDDFDRWARALGAAEMPAG